MSQSKISYAFSLVLLISLSSLSFASSTKQPHEDAEWFDGRSKTATKIQKTKKHELKSALSRVKEGVRAHNASLPDLGSEWGVLNKEIWSAVAPYLELEDFFRLYSCNRSFLELGEELILKRRFDTLFSNEPDIVINVPYEMNGKFNRRKNSLSYLIRDSIKIWVRFEVDQEYLNGEEDMHMCSYRAKYYAPIHPLVSEFFSLRVNLGNAFTSEEEKSKAMQVFVGHLKDGVSSFDTFSMELVFFTTLYVGKLFDITDDRSYFLGHCFPYESFNHKTVWTNLIYELADKTKDPLYLRNLICFYLNIKGDYEFEESAWNLLRDFLSEGSPSSRYLILKIKVLDVFSKSTWWDVDEDAPPISIRASQLAAKKIADSVDDSTSERIADAEHHLLKILKYSDSSDDKYNLRRDTLGCQLRLYLRANDVAKQGPVIKALTEDDAPESFDLVGSIFQEYGQRDLAKKYFDAAQKRQGAKV